MKIKWLGHSCFYITGTNGTTVVTDPYNIKVYPGAILHKEIDVRADYVTITHNHGDHNYAAGVHGAEKIDKPGHKKGKGVDFYGIQVYHDDRGGLERGLNTIFKIQFNDYNVVHLGDLGHNLNEQQLKMIGAVDVLLVPVGGTYTIDARTADHIINYMEPKIAIPMHFRNEKVLFPIEPVSNFLKWRKDYKVLNKSELEITSEILNSEFNVYVLDPAL